MDIDDAMARNKPKLDGPSEAHTEEQRKILSREIAAESSRVRAGLGAEPDPLAAELPGVQLPRVELLGVNALEVGEGQRAGPRRRRSTVLATAAAVVVVGGLLASVWYSTNRSNSTTDVIAASPPVETSASVTTSAPVEASPQRTHRRARSDHHINFGTAPGSSAAHRTLGRRLDQHHRPDAQSGKR